MKRLLPLYAAAFFQGFVLFYATEKLFMKSIGFDDASIGLMIAVYSMVMLVAETPSGILADRWSRKGVLILASVMLLLSSLIGGLSHSVPVFLISTGFWGIFFAMYSGTYESIVYDTLLEETGGGEGYEHFYGRIAMADSIALVIGSLAGGLASSQLGLRSVYWLTIPLALTSIIFLLRFKEPKLHKAEVAAPIKEHIAVTFRAVTRNRQLVPVVIALVGVFTLTYLLLEFTQLWLIALSAPIALFGVINSLYMAGFGLGGIAAARLKMRRGFVMFSTLALMALCASLLAVSRTLAVTVVATALLIVSLFGIRIVFTKMLHDQLSSKIRAGAASAISTAARLFMIPLALVFGAVSRQTNVFLASWILMGLLGVIIVFSARTYLQRRPVLVTKP